jgi:SAM-dependent methyltransferase
MDFDTRGYWEERLGKNWGLKGVGYRRLGANFNRWAYRVRGQVFLDTVRRTGLDVASADVLDVGSGTGFYIDLLDELGAQRVTGLDLAEAAVARLREQYPDKDFWRADIGGELTQLPAGPFDAVSAMDVLFHLVDDRAFATAMANIHDLLRPGGVFVWSDAFLHGPTERLRHIVRRSLADVSEVLARTGFEITERRPLQVLMNSPLDARLKLARVAWYAAAGAVSVSERLGDLAGRVLYPLEMRLVARRSESPSVEIMVCRRSS